MKQLTWLLSVVLITLSGCGPKEKPELTEAELVEKAKGIHDRVITLDTHNDINTTNFTTETNYIKIMIATLLVKLFQHYLRLNIN